MIKFVQFTKTYYTWYNTFQGSEFMENKYVKYSILVIVSLLMIVLCKTIIGLNILPTKFLVIGIIIAIVLIAITSLLVLNKKVFLNILGYILCAFIVIGSLVGTNYANHTINFFNYSFNNNKEITTYNVVVQKNSELNGLSDLMGRSIGVLEGENADATSKLKGINIVNYQDIYEMYEALINGRIESVFFESSILEVLDDNYKDIDSKVKVIYSFDLESKIIKKEEKVEIKPMSIYISGSDSRSNKIQNKSRSDVNMILTINPNTHTILMTSIPRDYYVLFHGQTGLKDKLTHAGVYGVDMSRQTLEDLFNTKIDYSVKVGFNAVVNVVDLVGGVDIDSDTSFNSSHIRGWHINKGMNHMNGQQALAYSRERYAYSSGDRHRVMNQQQVLEGVLKKISTDKSLLTKYDSLLKSVSDLYRTDIPASLIQDAIKLQLSEGGSWTFESISVSGSDASQVTHTTPNTKLYVMVPYEEDVKRASDKINEVLNGQGN